MGNSTASIRRLENVLEALPILASWFRDEWGPYYGPSGPGDAESDLAEALGPQILPVCFVAVDEKSKPIGTISLRKESLPSHRHLTPWAAALLVRIENRGQGVGEALLHAAESEARRLGFKRLYIGSSSASSRLVRRGWKLLDDAPTLRETTGVWELRLDTLN